MLTLEDTRPAELPPEQLAVLRSHLQEVLSSDAFMGGTARSASFNWSWSMRSLGARIASVSGCSAPRCSAVRLTTIPAMTRWCV